MQYYIKTFGCQMNISDSERISAVLDKLNFKEAKNITSANLVILNTCSVRASAESRALGLIRNLRKNNKKIKIGVTGCMIHIRPEKLKNNTDFIFDIKNLENLYQILSPYRQVSNLSQHGTDRLQTCLNTLKSSHQSNYNYFKINPRHQSTYHAYVPIMTGCNNFCTYCVVPYSRDREKSRPSAEIIKEINDLIKKGYKTITLLGQNVNSYGHDLTNEIKFPELLQKIASIPHDFWIWFITSHPKDMSDELIKVISKENKICPYLHLPVQSGSNKILKAMNRNYTKENYLKLVKNIRQKIKDTSLSTDIIVGFPGETRQDFQETVDVLKKAKFDMAYIARYSPRPKTLAFKLKNTVSNLEKKRRHKVLSKLLEKNSLAFNKKLIGKTVDVLIENIIKNNFYIGKTKTFKTVKILPTKNYNLQTNLIGQIIKVKIIKANNFGLEGKLI
jgi:tRNA-2-methylthio-N6-dimethylallyladenosine synthase